MNKVKILLLSAKKERSLEAENLNVPVSLTSLMRRRSDSLKNAPRFGGALPPSPPPETRALQITDVRLTNAVDWRVLVLAYVPSRWFHNLKEHCHTVTVQQPFRVCHSCDSAYYCSPATDMDMEVSKSYLWRQKPLSILQFLPLNIWK